LLLQKQLRLAQLIDRKSRRIALTAEEALPPYQYPPNWTTSSLRLVGAIEFLTDNEEPNGPDLLESLQRDWQIETDRIEVALWAWRWLMDHLKANLHYAELTVPRNPSECLNVPAADQYTRQGVYRLHQVLAARGLDTKNKGPSGQEPIDLSLSLDYFAYREIVRALGPYIIASVKSSRKDSRSLLGIKTTLQPDSYRQWCFG
jgi:hypothetical protein